MDKAKADKAGDDDAFSGDNAAVTSQVIGIFYDVANELGHGFVESVYRRSMFIALGQAGLRVEQEVAVPVSFRNMNVGIFHADLIVEGKVILELKVAEDVVKAFELQLLNYLRATTLETGLILAFGQRAKLKRIVMSNSRKPNLNLS